MVYKFFNKKTTLLADKSVSNTNNRTETNSDVFSEN